MCYNDKKYNKGAYKEICFNNKHMTCLIFELLKFSKTGNKYVLSTLKKELCSCIYVIEI